MIEILSNGSCIFIYILFHGNVAKMVFFIHFHVGYFVYWPTDPSNK